MPTKSETEPPVVFLSYRKADTQEQARELRDLIDGILDPVTAFFDETSIAAGTRWPDQIRDQLDQAAVVVVVVGKDWVGAHGERLLDDDSDWCRRELARALELHTPVIPVLVDGASMPPPTALPDCLREFAALQAVAIDPARRISGATPLLGRLRELLGDPRRESAPTPAASADPLACYRQHLRIVHAHLVTFPRAKNTLLDQVFVQLQLRTDRDAPASKAAFDVTTLQGMLECEPASATGVTGAWVVLGRPGAGKSTIARHLTWSLAERRDAAAPIPVYVPLASFASSSSDPLQMAEDELRRAAGDGDGLGLAACLRALAGPEGEPGRVWILLDGLDEVAPEHARELRDVRLPSLRRRLPNARVVVLSREVGFSSLAPDFRIARLQPLGRPQQRALLRGWLDADRADEILARLDARRQLARLAGNPLLLTLVAQLPGELPRDRAGLYGEVVELLLRKPYGRQTLVIDAPFDARRVLGGLALALQDSHEAVWSFDDLHAALWEARRASADLDRCVQSIWNGDNEAFLRQLAHRTGLLAAHDGPQAKWRFLHRQLREFLAAEALAVGRGDWQATVGALDKETIPRWSETLGFYCGQEDVDPLAVLGALRDANASAAVTALEHVVGVAPEVLLEFLWAIDAGESWDGDDLRRLVCLWEAEGHPAGDLARLLWERVTPALGLERLAWLRYALAGLGPVDDAAFFTQAGRPQRKDVGLDWRAIEGPRFAMGSPEEEPGRHDTEGPQREVRVAAFELARTAVTNAQYRLFDSDHSPETFGGKVKATDLDAHPAVNVGWWEAYLFSAWVGGRLPSEAEWEFACRATTTTPFSFDGTLTPERVNYDGNYPYADGDKGKYRGCTVPVGSLPANRWGLHEMHGNVWEWCQDRWHDSYEGAPEDGSAWELGGSGDRVLRGGSWIGSGGACRSAFRNRNAPGSRGRLVGFRPARSH